MKIVKSCLKQEVAAPRTLSMVPIGTIFRYNELSYGPYLRLAQGMLDLSNNCYTPTSEINFSKYVPLPNAYLVTGEE